jgi:hypothetical protein
MISLETIRQLKSLAANIKGTFNNPPYTREDFLAIYPQFTRVIPANVIDFYISMANASLSYDIYRDQWVYAMGLYVGHFLTLWLQMTNGLDENSPASKIIQNSMAQGLLASKSAGSLSLSYDNSTVDNDLQGWAAWKLTKYGMLFASLAKLMGKPGSYIW